MRILCRSAASPLENICGFDEFLSLNEPDDRLARRLIGRLINARRDHAGNRARLLRPYHRLRHGLRTALKEAMLIFDYALGGLATAFILGYLIYALVRPERF